MPEYWIQIENRPWDVCPHNIDRMTGQNLKDLEGTDPVTVTLSSPGTGMVRNNVTMFRPLRKADGTVDDALILRRYKPPQQGDQSDAWTIPDDRKVNPWDINEPDPSDGGTMGTIPGPVIECNVGESVTVHFRNLDNRTQPGTQTICFPFPFIGQICLPVSDPGAASGGATYPQPASARIRKMSSSLGHETCKPDWATNSRQLLSREIVTFRIGPEKAKVGRVREWPAWVAHARLKSLKLSNESERRFSRFLA